MGSDDEEEGDPLRVKDYYLVEDTTMGVDDQGVPNIPMDLDKYPTLWKPNVTSDMIALDYGYLVVRFFSKADYTKVLTQGSWVVMGHYLAVTVASPTWPTKSSNWVRH